MYKPVRTSYFSSEGTRQGSRRAAGHPDLTAHPVTFVAHFDALGHADMSPQRRTVMVGKYRLLTLAIAALVFVVIFWYFNDPIFSILGAMIALVFQTIFFAFVTEDTLKGKNK
jgi:hypothetical protein